MMTIQRVICFKFKKGTSQEEITRHMHSLAALQSAIPQIKTYAASLTVPDELGNLPSFDSLHYVTFATMADVETYFHHQAHQDFIAENKHIWEDVLVLNGELHMWIDR